MPKKNGRMDTGAQKGHSSWAHLWALRMSLCREPRRHSSITMASVAEPSLREGTSAQAPRKRTMKGWYVSRLCRSTSSLPHKFRFRIKDSGLTSKVAQ